MAKQQFSKFAPPGALARAFPPQQFISGMRAGSSHRRAASARPASASTGGTRPRASASELTFGDKRSRNPQERLRLENRRLGSKPSTIRLEDRGRRSGNDTHASPKGPGQPPPGDAENVDHAAVSSRRTGG